jgi:hypothetical protein
MKKLDYGNIGRRRLKKTKAGIFNKGGKNDFFNTKGK